jgi:predicted PurR-regulated permease PerM
MPSQDRLFYSRVFGLVTLSLLGVALFWMMQPFLVPLLWAALLAVLLFPANLTLRRGLRGHKALAALLLTSAVVLIIVFPAVVGVSLFVSQASDLAARLQAMAKEYQIAQPSDVFAIPAVDHAIRWVSERLPISGEQAQAWLVQGGQHALQVLLGIFGSLFTGVLGVFANVVLGLFLFFFFLRDGERMIARLMGLVPLDERKKSHLVAHLSAVTTAVVLGSLVTAVVQGALVGTGFAIAGLPAPVVFGALAMIASLVPIVGSSLVWVPAAITLAAHHRWGWAIFLTVWCLGLVHSADNVIRPLFISSRAKISTLPVFVGLLGGVSAFGAIGMFLGPVLVALVLALVEFWEELRAEGEASLEQAPPTEPT